MGGQVLRLTEEDACARFLHFVVASLGALRKDKTNGVVTARVLLGIFVNRRARIRDQERTPISADLTRVMREKSLWTFAHTAAKVIGRSRSHLVTTL